MPTLNTIMGKGWKYRNHMRQAGFDTQPFYGEESECDERSSARSWTPEHHLGEYAVTGRHRAPCGPESIKKVNSRHQDQNYRPRSCPRQPRHTQPAFVPGPSHSFDQATFSTSPSLLREYLIESFHHILCQIQRWYPEETTSSNDDKMDWQPEREITGAADVEIHL